MPKKIKGKYRDCRKKYKVIDMSQVILDFAEPLLEDAEGQESHVEAIEIAIACWNLSFCSKEIQENRIDKMVNYSGPKDDSAGVMEGLYNLIKIKSEVFSYINRYIADYKLIWHDDYVDFNVTSKPIPPCGIYAGGVLLKGTYR